jgi:hypothetical protein
MSNHILPSAKSKRVKVKQKHYDKPHMIIPQEDLDWVLKQKPAVYTLWGECWRADPYGSRMMQLNTTLPRSTFMRAKKVLADAGLFIFNRKTSTRDSRETVCWEVQNLHGARVKDYWEKLTPNEPLNESRQLDSISDKQDVVSHKQDVVSHQRDSISSQTLTQQGSQNPSVTPHKHLSNSSKELLRCADPTNSENLVAHLEAAVRGVLPSKGIIYQLRDSKYWVNFTGAARAHGWNLRELLAED